jgi:hypothetical protein
MVNVTLNWQMRAFNYVVFYEISLREKTYLPCMHSLMKISGVHDLFDIYSEHDIPKERSI